MHHEMSSNPGDVQYLGNWVMEKWNNLFAERESLLEKTSQCFLRHFPINLTPELQMYDENDYS